MALAVILRAPRGRPPCRRRVGLLVGFVVAFVVGLLVVLWARPRVAAWLEVDACLDRGGAWDERTEACREGEP